MVCLSEADFTWIRVPVKRSLEGTALKKPEAAPWEIPLQLPAFAIAAHTITWKDAAV